jgi:hypothetical protein
MEKLFPYYMSEICKVYRLQVFTRRQAAKRAERSQRITAELNQRLPKDVISLILDVLDL